MRIFAWRLGIALLLTAGSATAAPILPAHTHNSERDAFVRSGAQTAHETTAFSGDAQVGHDDAAHSLALDRGIISPGGASLQPDTEPGHVEEAASQLLASPLPSGTAQHIYAQAREQLVQVRTLVRGDNSQATVGSGFLVGKDGLIITNYHVISTVALQPQRYRLSYTTSSGQRGPLELLAFDLVHDLALLRAPGDTFKNRKPLQFRAADRPLQRGERIFSLGNPLDVGFAVVEGNYNGLVERSFYPNIFFGGALSPGMSGGPALDESGHIIGINVATRRDGQQVSFLVPARFAEQLVQRSAGAKPMPERPAYAEITRQLMAHQQLLTDRFIALPWLHSLQDGYEIPMPEQTFMRCWGQSTPADTKGLRVRMSDCGMDSQTFISEQTALDGIEVQHRLFDGSNIGPWRFAQQYSNLFQPVAVDDSGDSDDHLPGKCEEHFVEHNGLTMRAVICLRAYTKLKGLYDLDVLLASVNQSDRGVQSAFSVDGVDYKNAMRLTSHFLKGFGWKN